MKKLLSALLALTIAVQLVPVQAMAKEPEDRTYEVVTPYETGDDLMEITRDNAPIRTGASKKKSALEKCSRGTVIAVTGSTVNHYLHRWYKTEVDGRTGYIYSKNVKKHSHQYTDYEVDGMTYHVCRCGRIAVTVEREAEKALASSAGAIMAGGLAATQLDGPIPGPADLVGLGILVAGGIIYACGEYPDAGTIQSVLEDVNMGLIEMTPEGVCPPHTFRKVRRTWDNLRYMDKKCMNPAEAYVYVLAGGDVYSTDPTAAYNLGHMHPNGCFAELDAARPGHYNHYHLGKKNPRQVEGGHIFYGLAYGNKATPS